MNPFANRPLVQGACLPQGSSHITCGHVNVLIFNHSLILPFTHVWTVALVHALHGARLLALQMRVTQCMRMLARSIVT